MPDVVILYDLVTILIEMRSQYSSDFRFNNQARDNLLLFFLNSALAFSSYGKVCEISLQ